MKTLIVTAKQLKDIGRWDIDYHLPPVGIISFPEELRVQVKKCADFIKKKRDPTKNPDRPFQYIDIASIDVITGAVSAAQELTGLEAPSRARKVVHAYDILVSTCRPTRGAIAVVPEALHGQICSTGFSVVRAKAGVNPFYLHFALRLGSTLEQFRKWSTGSSYPAILDDDVSKTQIPLPLAKVQDQIARVVRCATAERDAVIHEANKTWKTSIDGVIANLEKKVAVRDWAKKSDLVFSIDQVAERLAKLPPVEEEAFTGEEETGEQDMFGEEDK